MTFVVAGSKNKRFKRTVARITINEYGMAFWLITLVSLSPTALLVAIATTMVTTENWK